MKYIFCILIMSFTMSDAKAESMPKELSGIINKQIKAELDAAYIYLDMANHANHLSLTGIANFFTSQFYEEINHAREMMQFMADRGVPVKLSELSAPTTPKVAPGKLLNLFEVSLEHEVEQSGRINKIVALSRKLDGFAVEQFFHKFVEEQVEEEALFTEMVDKFRIAGENPAALLELDHHLAKRALPKIFQPAH